VGEPARQGTASGAACCEEKKMRLWIYCIELRTGDGKCVMPPTIIYSNAIILKKNTEMVTLEASNKILVSLNCLLCDMNTFPTLTRIHPNLCASLCRNLQSEL
jgi:hypothetical protein